MNNLVGLIAYTGNWQGINSLWLSPKDPAQESATTLSILPTLKKKFIEVKYTWAYDGQPQEGILLVGYETERQLATTVWADSWHMGEKIMQCQGVIQENGGIDVRGLYQVPTGPDWGWRIVVDPEGKNTLNLIMYNITPEGEEALAVKAVYSKTAKP
jgi:hypothetical protein